MKEITYREALREAIAEEMRRDATVFMMGEDIAYHGGAFKVSLGLVDEFGEARIKDTPLAESVLTGAAVGAALVGVRPIVELMFADFIVLAMDHIINAAAKMCYLHAGEASVPMVLRTSQGAGTSSGAHHCQSVEGWLMNVPGIKLVMPSTPYDAKGLMKAAIRDNNPVVFLEHKMLYASKGLIPEEEYLIPLGQADVKREGTDATVIATANMVPKALRAAEKLASEGISVEVVDPRTLKPLDTETLVKSVKKTRQALIVHEACLTGGPGAEIAAVLAKEAIDYLDAPVLRIGGMDSPVPFSPTMEKYFIPDENKIIHGVRALLA